MTTNSPIRTAVVLAGGKGTRMKSELPKVLFPVLGRPMIHWVLDALEDAGFSRVLVVVGYREELVRSELAMRAGVEFITQSPQLGTGHAVMVCREALPESGLVMVVAGDSPLIQASSIRQLLEKFESSEAACMLGTLVKESPFGLGRIVRDKDGRFEKIVEEKDASDQQRQIQEVNMSTYLFEAVHLRWALDHLDNKNAQQEYYLTDCPALLLEAGQIVEAHPVLKPCEALSINTLDELASVEAKMQELGYPCAS